MPRFIESFAIVLIGLSLVACSSTPGSETTSTETGAENTAADDQEAAREAQVAAAFDPIKCVKYTPSGTRISQKICKKRSEWDRLREQREQRDMQDLQRRSVFDATTE